MHFLLYVCLPADEAKSSLRARQFVCRYLEEEHFVSGGRFCGRCDYFSVGGRYSGILPLLRLKHHHPQEFERFLKQYGVVRTPSAAVKLFKKSFPNFKGRLPVNRRTRRFYGYQDDAHLMDEALFSELKAGFDEDARYAIAFEKPNVIFTDLDESEWPDKADAAAGRHWVVAIDYHD